VFNPTHEARQYGISVTERHVQRGELQTIVHSFYQLSGSKARVAQAIAINNVGDAILRRSVRVTTKMSTLDYGEYTMRTDLSSDFSKSTTEIFTDNSVETSKRQYYTMDGARNANLTKNQKTEWIGLNGYATIHGSAFRSDADKYFAFANSNSLLLNALGRNEYELMLMRNTNYYDDKGITDPLRDKNMETFDQVMFLAKSTDEYYDMNKRISAFLNSRLIARKTSHRYNSSDDTSEFGLFDTLGLSANFGDIDFIDLRVIDKHNVNLKIRNRAPYMQVLDPSVKITSHHDTGKMLNNEPIFKVNLLTT
jgi:hypothetical protein